MSDEGTTAVEETEDTKTTDQTVPYARFEQVNKKAKEHAEQVKQLTKELGDLKSMMKDAEEAGLPEVEKLTKRLEAAEARASAAEKAQQDAEARVTGLTKEQWVTAAARDLNFIDPEDALNPRHIDLGVIESQEDAEKALKRLAKSKAHLVKPDEPERPQIGRVLQDGKPANGNGKQQGQAPADVDDPAFKQQLGAEMLGVLRGGQ